MNKKSEKACEVHARSGLKLQHPTCPAALPSIPSATRPFSFHCTGGTICWRGGWSRLPARSSAAACCLLFARSTE